MPRYMRGSASVVVDRPIGEVFGFVADPGHMELWLVGVTNVQPADSEPITQGSRFDADYTYAAGTHRIAYEVVESEPPGAFAVRSISGPFPFKGRLDLESENGGTRVTKTFEAGPDGVFTSVMFLLLRPVLEKKMSKQIERELVALRAIIHAQA